MYKKLIAIITLLLVICSSVHAQFDTIINRYRHYLLKSTEPEGEIKHLIGTLNANQQWDDINYNDTERANWQPLIHLKRVRDLALVWSHPGSPYYQQETVRKAIDAGLSHWLEKKYKSSNWWHNEIGVPQCIRDIVVLLSGTLTGEQLAESMKVLAQHKVQYNGVGANLTWSADLGFHYGVLTNNLDLMQKCRDLVIKEIRITTGEGVQPDLSFHQHDKRLQMYQYGKAFLWENVRLAWELRGTQLAFPKEKVKILTDFILGGWQWMARGIHTVPGTMDRSNSRIDALQSADIRLLVSYLIELSPGNAEAFKALANRNNGKGSLVGYRYYPCSDFAAYHQKGFSFFLKTISTRTLATESINNENLKGRLLNSGDSYMIKSGKEYFNLMPVWDWQRLPGVTSFKGAYKINRKPFVGSVSNGKVGLTVMDYQLEDKSQKQMVTAKKLWASHENLIVCLIAGLEAQGSNEVIYTTLDQCRWEGDVIVNRLHNVLKEGDHVLNAAKWIYHSGFVYIPLKSGQLNLQLKPVSGTWKSINSSLADKLVTDKVFLASFNHGSNVKDLSTGYVLASCPTAAKAQLLVRKPTWKVLRNDKECQAVSFKNGTVMVSFYSSASLEVSVNKQLAVDRPCLILIDGNKLYASDPLHKGGDLAVRWENKTIQFKLPANGNSSEGKVLLKDNLRSAKHKQKEKKNGIVSIN